MNLSPYIWFILLLLEYSIIQCGSINTDLLLKCHADTKLYINFINKNVIIKEYAVNIKNIPKIL